MWLIKCSIAIIISLSTWLPLVQCVLQIQRQTEIILRVKRFSPGKKSFSDAEVNRYKNEFKSKIKSYYLGCKLNQYEDDHLKTGFSFPQMIPEICLGHCKQHKFNYGLLSKGNTCTCKKFINKLKSISSSDCFSPCTGRKKEKCGGPNHQLVSAYKVKQKEVKPDYVEKVVVPSYFIGAGHSEANRPAIVVNKKPEHERARKIAMARFAWRREFNKRAKAQPGEGMPKPTLKPLTKPSFKYERLMDKASPHEYKRLQRLAAEKDKEWEIQFRKELEERNKNAGRPARGRRAHRRGRTSRRRGHTSRRARNKSQRQPSRHGRNRSRGGRNRKRRRRRRRRRRRNRHKQKGQSVKNKQNKFKKGKKFQRGKSKVSVENDTESESGAVIIHMASHHFFTTAVCFAVFLINQSKYS